MGHLAEGLEGALAVARELAVGETSATKDRRDAEWDAGGDAFNERRQREWAALPLAEVRKRFHDAPGELRGTLTVVPEVRWLKHPTNMEFLAGETIDHYAEHEADLAAILAAARARLTVRGRGRRADRRRCATSRSRRSTAWTMSTPTPGRATQRCSARAGHPFAVLTEGELDVRLEPLVATAALRTPDTTESSRGPRLGPLRARGPRPVRGRPRHRLDRARLAPRRGVTSAYEPLGVVAGGTRPQSGVVQRSSPSCARPSANGVNPSEPPKLRLMTPAGIPRTRTMPPESPPPTWTPDAIRHGKYEPSCAWWVEVLALLRHGAAPVDVLPVDLDEVADRDVRAGERSRARRDDPVARGAHVHHVQVAPRDAIRGDHEVVHVRRRDTCVRDTGTWRPGRSGRRRPARSSRRGRRATHPSPAQ